MRFTLSLPDENATIIAGRLLARFLRPSDVVHLQGPLGAGKSCLARALIRALPFLDGQIDPEAEVPSPTFTLVQTYPRAIGMIWHFDLYRLGDPEEVYELGLDEAYADGICLIEWPDRLGPFAQADRLELRLATTGEGRTLMLEGMGSTWQNRLASIKPTFKNAFSGTFE